MFPVLALLWIVAVKHCVIFRWSELGQSLRSAFVSTAVMVLAVLLPQITILRSLGPVPRSAIEITLGIASYLGCLMVFILDRYNNSYSSCGVKKPEALAVGA